MLTTTRSNISHMNKGTPSRNLPREIPLEMPNKTGMTIFTKTLFSLAKTAGLFNSCHQGDLVNKLWDAYIMQGYVAREG